MNKTVLITVVVALIILSVLVYMSEKKLKSLGAKGLFNGCGCGSVVLTQEEVENAILDAEARGNFAEAERIMARSNEGTMTVNDLAKASDDGWLKGSCYKLIDGVWKNVPCPTSTKGK